MMQQQVLTVSSNERQRQIFDVIKGIVLEELKIALTPDSKDISIVFNENDDGFIIKFVQKNHIDGFEQWVKKNVNGVADSTQSDGMYVLVINQEQVSAIMNMKIARVQGQATSQLQSTPTLQSVPLAPPPQISIEITPPQQVLQLQSAISTQLTQQQQVIWAPLAPPPQAHIAVTPPQQALQLQPPIPTQLPKQQQIIEAPLATPPQAHVAVTSPQLPIPTQLPQQQQVTGAPLAPLPQPHVAVTPPQQTLQLQSPTFMQPPLQQKLPLSSELQSSLMSHLPQPQHNVVVTQLQNPSQPQSHFMPPLQVNPQSFHTQQLQSATPLSQFPQQQQPPNVSTQQLHQPMLPSQVTTTQLQFAQIEQRSQLLPTIPRFVPQLPSVDTQHTSQQTQTFMSSPQFPQTMLQLQPQTPPQLPQQQSHDVVTTLLDAPMHLQLPSQQMTQFSMPTQDQLSQQHSDTVATSSLLHTRHHRQPRPQASSVQQTELQTSHSTEASATSYPPYDASIFLTEQPQPCSQTRQLGLSASQPLIHPQYNLPLLQSDALNGMFKAANLSEIPSVISCPDQNISLIFEDHGNAEIFLRWLDKNIGLEIGATSSIILDEFNHHVLVFNNLQQVNAVLNYQSRLQNSWWHSTKSFLGTWVDRLVIAEAVDTDAHDTKDYGYNHSSNTTPTSAPLSQSHAATRVFTKLTSADLANQSSLAIVAENIEGLDNLNILLEKLNQRERLCVDRQGLPIISLTDDGINYDIFQSGGPSITKKIALSDALDLIHQEQAALAQQAQTSHRKSWFSFGKH